jgi:hypothetical protein
MAAVYTMAALPSSPESVACVERTSEQMGSACNRVFINLRKGEYITCGNMVHLHTNQAIPMQRFGHVLTCTYDESVVRNTNFPSAKKKIASAFDITFGLFYAGHGSRASAWIDLRM